MQILPLLLAFQQGTPATYPVFENDNLPPALYQARREQVKRQLGPGGVALVVTNPTRNRSNDTDFRYRPDSNFYYLTGFNEPDAALLLVPGGIEIEGKRVTELLFVNTSNPMSETWLGYRMGPSNAPRLLGIEASVPNRSFSGVLSSLKPTEWAATSVPDPNGTVQMMLNEFTKWRGSTSAKFNLERYIGTMRVKKSPEELVLLQKAIDASVLAHAEAIRSVEPGMREFEAQAVVEYVFTRKGCEFTGYNSIVGSGPNSCILHYETNRRQMAGGDIICMDVGGEYHGYTADITRSFPVNGKFTPEQRAIYDLVKESQDAGIAACKVGNAFNAPHQAASDVLLKGLTRLGIIQNARDLNRYFMHGTSHYLGLDVHDSHGDNELKAGYTLTVEPGIYIKAGSPCDKKWWNIGVRIEDDVLVTEKGPVNMSGALPRTSAAIEALMREKGIGNSIIKMLR